MVVIYSFSPEGDSGLRSQYTSSHLSALPYTRYVDELIQHAG